MVDKSLKKTRYAVAGVSLEAASAVVDRLGPLAAATARPGADGTIGGFGGLFDLAACDFSDPVLVAATDGVGTKLMLASAVGQFDTIGLDLVAMCVNDVLVQGATPLFFLDYYAAGQMDVDTVAAVVSGIAAGCRLAGCALIGGETAELPGLYRPGHFDLAGFVVGAAERRHLLTGDLIAPGDIVLGLASNGVHSNGFSLVRHIVSESGLEYSVQAPFDPDRDLGEALLAPTRIYVESLLPLVSRNGSGIRGLAHITGGGLRDNIARILPDTVTAALDATKWSAPPVFDWLAKCGNVPTPEMIDTFNCGLGMVAIVEPELAQPIASELESRGERVWQVGQIVPRLDELAVTIAGLDTLFS